MIKFLLRFSGLPPQAVGLGIGFTIENEGAVED